MTCFKSSWRTPIWKCSFWLYTSFFLVALLSIFVFTPLLERYDLHPFKVMNDKASQTSCFKQDITKDLNQIHLEMQKLFTHKQAPSAKLIQRLGEVINRLEIPQDNKEQTRSNEKEQQTRTNEVEQKTSSNEKEQQSGSKETKQQKSSNAIEKERSTEEKGQQTRDNKIGPQTSSNKTEDHTRSNETVTTEQNLDVCPEIYIKEKGHPFYAKKGWHTINCTNVKPLRAVISILVNTVAYPKDDEKHIENVLKGITQTYPTIQVLLATRSDKVLEAAKKYKNVDGFKVNDDKLSKVWNTLNSKVSTPYVLIARDVFHFTWFTQLERQIRVISQIPNVSVAGGSHRNMLGHWKASCVQTTLKNFMLEYQEGYYHSKNECMYCDYLQGPFVTKTNLLKFDESLPDEVIFEDWFLRLVGDGNQIMSCPDAMYFTTDYNAHSKHSDKNIWTPLAKKWELNRVLLPQGVKHSFSCKDISFNCNPHHELLPICCQEEYADALYFLQNFTDKHNIGLELDCGSALGGVKFNGLIPWDIDGDVFVSSNGIEIFSQTETIEYFKKNGYVLAEYQPAKRTENGGLNHGYVKIYFNGFNIEVWGWNVTSNSVYLPTELQKREMFTKANIRGNWIVTMFSPGLFARNRYGREILKHSQSWRKVGLSDSYGLYSPGSFKPCDRPKHHSCLQNYPGDGNLPFMET